MANATPDEQEDVLLPGVDPVINDDVKITGVDDMVTPEMTLLEVEIADPEVLNIPDPAPIENMETPAAPVIPNTAPVLVLDPEIPEPCHSA